MHIRPVEPCIGVRFRLNWIAVSEGPGAIHSPNLPVLRVVAVAENPTSIEEISGYFIAQPSWIKRVDWRIRWNDLDSTTSFCPVKIPFEEEEKAKPDADSDSDLAEDELEDIDDDEDSPDNDVDLGGDDDLGVAKAADDKEDDT